MISKDVNNNKCAPKLIFFNEKKKKNEKDSYNFRHRKLIMKVEFWHFLTPPHYTTSQNSITSFEYVDFEANIFLIVYPPLENSTTRNTIREKQDLHLILSLIPTWIIFTNFCFHHRYTFFCIWFTFTPIFIVSFMG